MSGALQAGDVFAGYRIDAILGRGGMGVVYRAEDLHLGRIVALKVLAPDRANDLGFRDRFLRESKLLASIDHRNIVDVFHADEVDGQLFLVMRFIEGFDLGELISRDGRLEPAVVAHVIREAAEALDEAHSHGLVHRDVKPGNVLIAPRGRPLDQARVYLSDFGLTKRADGQSQLTTVGQFLGTPAYVAPEQIQGSSVDGRADLYALACVAYECLTGMPPYHEAGEAAILMAHLIAPPPDLSGARPDLPPEAATAIARGMAKSRDQRPDNCVAFAAALQEALAAVPSKPSEGVPDAPPRPAPVATIDQPASGSPAGPAEVVTGPPNGSGDADATLLVQPVETEPRQVQAVGAEPTVAQAPPPTAAQIPTPAAGAPPPAALAEVTARPAPPLGAGRTSRRTSVAAAIGAGVVGLALVATAAFAFGWLGAAGPSAPPTGTSIAATATPAPPTAAPDPSRAFPDAAEARLLNMVPQLLRGTCQRSDVVPEDLGGAAAVLECAPTGHLAPDIVRYVMYPSDGALEDAYQSWLADAQRVTTLRNEPTRCEALPHTGGYGDFDHGSAPGKLICYADADGRAVFAWSVKVLRVMSEAIREDGDAAQLYEWWADPQRSGPLG